MDPRGHFAKRVLEMAFRYGIWIIFVAAVHVPGRKYTTRRIAIKASKNSLQFVTSQQSPLKQLHP